MYKKRFINGCSKSIYLVKAFEDMGWDAWTCDILPSEGWHKHIQDDIRNHFNDGWDLGIFHPDCTHLSNSGVQWLHKRPMRVFDLCQSIKFFNECRNAPIDKVCVENPIQHKYARMFIPIYSQIIQPYYFGENEEDRESKATCLWLKGLPPLMAHFSGGEGIKQSCFLEPPGPNQKANRSRNFKGISLAMAQQWG